MTSAQTAIGKFEAAGLTWMRPPDYFAEMVKTDEHMNRVKETLMHEQKAIELAEDRCVRLAVLDMVEWRRSNIMVFCKV